MAKVVIIAPSDVDVTDAIKLLKGAGHDVQFEEPTPKALLHIVLGLMGPNAYGFGPGYAYVGGPDATDDDAGSPDDGDAIEGEPTAEPVGDLDGADDINLPAAEDDLGDVDFNFESTTVDGIPVEAVVADQEHSTLVVEELTVGPKTTYTLNESKFSFWPNDLAMPMQRVDVGASRVHTSLEVEVKQGEKTQLLVGKDLLEILVPVRESVEDRIAKHSDWDHHILVNDTPIGRILSQSDGKVKAEFWLDDIKQIFGAVPKGLSAKVTGTPAEVAAAIKLLGKPVKFEDHTF